MLGGSNTFVKVTLASQQDVFTHFTSEYLLVNIFTSFSTLNKLNKAEKIARPT